MMRLILLSALLLIGAAPASTPDREALMDRIEAHILLPRDSAPLADYGRYYAWDRQSPEHSRVIGVYLNAGSWEPGRRWVEQNALPGIFDGGCGMISFRYDVAADRIEQVACNGLG